jgi:hypothetical protein
VVNISEPDTPAVVTHLDVGNNRAVHGIGDYLYTLSSWDGVTMYDISDPEDPVERGYFNTNGYARNLYVVDNLVYVADGGGGFYILRNDDIDRVEDTEAISTGYSLAQNYPNPFNPKTVISWQLARGSHIEVSIFNLLGQRVTTLVSEWQAAGQHRIEWNATGLASGVYYYRLATSSCYQKTKKLVIMK